MEAKVQNGDAATSVRTGRHSALVGLILILPNLLLTFGGSARAEAATEHADEAGFWCVDTVDACERMIDSIGFDAARTAKTPQVRAIEAEQAGQEEGSAANDDRTGPEGELAPSAVSGDGSLSGRFAWRLGARTLNYAYCDDTNCTRPGQVTVNATINLSGRGTGDLIMTSEVADTSDSPAAVAYQNTCRGLPGRRCGSRFYGENPFSYDSQSYNFARAGEGYVFADARNYDIRFQWIIDPLNGPEGAFFSPLYNSYNFTCPRGDEACFFPEWENPQ